MSAQTNKPLQEFLPAKPSAWMISFFQQLSKLDLDHRNHVFVPDADLEILNNLPRNCGIILTPNHADEMDPRICFELSRMSRHRFIFMCNREAFHELNGFAGWGLQKVGCFSVERGGHDTAAMQYAVKVVEDATDILVIFPEGEIFYLNQQVQAFHSGAIEIGMQAIMSKRQTNPGWTTYLVPMSIKYHYKEPINDVLEERISKMEKALNKGMTGDSFHTRVAGIVSELVSRKEKERNIDGSQAVAEELSGRINNVQHAMLSELEEKYKNSYKMQARTLDQAFQIGASVREHLKLTISSHHKTEYLEDLLLLKEVQHLVSWQPQYIDEDPSSPERIAEMVIKLEREIFKIDRPKQLGKRNVFVRIGDAIDLSTFIDQYKEKPHVVRHDLAENLRTKIQDFITGS